MRDDLDVHVRSVRRGTSSGGAVLKRASILFAVLAGIAAGSVRAPASPGRRLLLGATLAIALRPRRSRAQYGGDRVALVIGNSAYVKIAPLKNPVNDADTVAASLERLGFSVIQRENTTLRELIETLREFSLRAAQSQVRVFFYAGHGIQAKGRNYLIPVDIDLRSEDELPVKSADASAFIDRLSALKHGINIVILDACRVNPFAGGVIVGPDGRRIRFRGMSSSGGLAPVDSPLGTLIAYSAAPNGIALDNPGERNSVYVKHLVANLGAPGVPVELLFKKVRIGVAEETKRVQIPWESSSLTADYCFRPGTADRCGAGSR